MTWLLFSLICIFGWGFADYFYKKSNESGEWGTHFQTTVFVGLLMGITSLCLLPFSETFSESGFSFSLFLKKMVAYSPASLSYILSMIIGYAGLRYLELSVVSPIQNASGAFALLLMSVYFFITGHAEKIAESFGIPEIIGTVFCVGGVILLAVFEKKESDANLTEGKRERRFRYGVLALLFPLLYCLFDTVGTAADGIILDSESGQMLGEIDVLILYGLTFFLAAVVCYIILFLKNKRPYRLFRRSEAPKALAALFEQFGQIFYVYAMAENPLLSAPLVASYCIVSVILSRIFLHEKLSLPKKISVILVIAGIVLFGISEGMNG